MALEVERIDPRGEDPGEKLKTEIERGSIQGKTLINVVPLFNEILLIWDKPKEKTENATSKPAAEKR